MQYYRQCEFGCYMAPHVDPNLVDPLSVEYLVYAASGIQANVTYLHASVLIRWMVVASDWHCT